MANTLTGRERTAAAVAANRRRRQERIAQELRDAGWWCIPPESVHESVVKLLERGPGGTARVEFQAPVHPGQLALGV